MWRGGGGRDGSVCVWGGGGGLETAVWGVETAVCVEGVGRDGCVCVGEGG